MSPPARRKPSPAARLAAAAYIVDPELSLADAGAAHGVSRQAVQAAIQRAAVGRTGTPGRKPRGDSAAVQRVSVRVDDARISVRVTDAERAAFAAAAERAGIDLSSWMRAQSRAPHTAVRIRDRCRRAVGMPEE